MLPVRFRVLESGKGGRTERIPSKKDREETASKTTLLDEETTRSEWRMIEMIARMKWNFHAGARTSMKVDLLQPARLFVFHFLLPSPSFLERHSLSYLRNLKSWDWLRPLWWKVSALPGYLEYKDPSLHTLDICFHPIKDGETPLI